MAVIKKNKAVVAITQFESVGLLTSSTTPASSPTKQDSVKQAQAFRKSPEVATSLLANLVYFVVVFEYRQHYEYNYECPHRL